MKLSDCSFKNIERRQASGSLTGQNNILRRDSNANVMALGLTQFRLNQLATVKAYDRKASGGVGCHDLPRNDCARRAHPKIGHRGRI